MSWRLPTPMVPRGLVLRFTWQNGPRSRPSRRWCGRSPLKGGCSRDSIGWTRGSPAGGCGA